VCPCWQLVSEGMECGCPGDGGLGSEKGPRGPICTPGPFWRRLLAPPHRELPTSLGMPVCRRLPARWIVSVGRHDEARCAPRASGNLIDARFQEQPVEEQARELEPPP